MRALIQRVAYGSVCVNRELIAEIPKGMVVLLGIGRNDREGNARALAGKISSLRIFNDGNGKMNLSVREVSGEILAIPQFTLYANASHGHRPDLIRAAPRAMAEPLYEFFLGELAALGIPVRSGLFGADMLVEIHNDGPVTIWLENEGDGHQIGTTSPLV